MVSLHVFASEGWLIITFFARFPQYSLGYRPFMMLLQPQVCLLDKFVIQQESIPNLMPIGMKANHVAFNSTRPVVDLEHLTKNVSQILSFQG